MRLAAGWPHFTAGPGRAAGARARRRGTTSRQGHLHPAPAPAPDLSNVSPFAVASLRNADATQHTPFAVPTSRAPELLASEASPLGAASAWVQVQSVYLDCDRDSLIYLSEPIGPACHTNAPTCYFTQADAASGELRQAGSHHSREHAPMTTLFALERTIAQRKAEAEAGTSAGGLATLRWVPFMDGACRHGSLGRSRLGLLRVALRQHQHVNGCTETGEEAPLSIKLAQPAATAAPASGTPQRQPAAHRRSPWLGRSTPCYPLLLRLRPMPPGGKPSWTAKLLANPELLCKKVREEAGELCQTLEQGEGAERAASEAADLIYHAMVLLNAQVGGWAGGRATGRGGGWSGGAHGAASTPCSWRPQQAAARLLWAAGLLGGARHH